jgi:MFS family permease
VIALTIGVVAASQRASEHGHDQLPTLLGPILGPVVGGLIVSHLSWRWIFLVNVPFSIAGLVLAWRGMAQSTPR